MKKANKLNFKIALLLVVALLFSVCATALLVACDNNNNDDNQSDSPLQNIVGSAIGYADANSLALTVYCTIDEPDEDGGRGMLCIGFVDDIQNGNRNVSVTYSIAYLFFDTEENATTYYKKNYLQETEEQDLRYILQNNYVICEVKQGLYDKVAKCSLPQNVAESKEYEFIKNFISKQNDKSFFVGGTIIFDTNHNFNVSYEMWNDIESSNCSEEYACISKNIFSIYNNNRGTWEEVLAEYDVTGKLGTEYTNDSYCKVENDVMYAYRKDMPGLRYEETQDGYAVTMFYYDKDTDTITVPGTYNNKPVVKIENLSYNCHDIKTVKIPVSVTNIYSNALDSYSLPNLSLIVYEGTKAQWQSMYASESVHCTVRCSDGEIAKQPTE